MNILHAYWCSFKNNFKKIIENSTQAELIKAWESQTERTTFYTKSVLPKVASELGLHYIPEMFKVDFVMCGKSSNGHEVPLIFIESENNAGSAYKEIQKLCSVSSPLKVLISCVEWCEDPGYWSSGGEKSKLLEEWRSIMAAHNEVWPQPSVYGIIIGEMKNDVLRFYSIGLSASGSEIDTHQILVDRRIS